MELNFVSFEQAATYATEAPHHVVFGEAKELESHIEKYSQYFKQFHYFHYIKVDGEIIGLVIESLM